MAKKLSMTERRQKMRAPLPEPAAPAEPKGRRSEADNRVILSVWVDPALRQHLKAVAVKQNTTLNEMLQRYIHAGLQNDGETLR